MNSQPRVPHYTSAGGLGVFVADLRAWVFASKAQAGRSFGLAHTTIVRYENGQILPPPGYLACLARLVGERIGDREAPGDMVRQALMQEVNHALRDCYPDTPLLQDWHDLCRCADAYRQERPPAGLSADPLPAARVVDPAVGGQSRRIDWGEAPNLRPCFGRHAECVRLAQWISIDHAQVVGIWGMGGIGKTTLAVHLVQHLADQYDYVIWRSLLNAPPADSLVAEYRQAMADQPSPALLGRFDLSVAVLLDYFRAWRCLIVLDNMEAVLRSGEYAGHYRAGYDAYGELLRRAGETRHQSCLVLTSREPPREFRLLESAGTSVRSLVLGGVAPQTARTLVEATGIAGTDAIWATLNTHYAGNPLALKLVAETIRTFFAGDIAAFLRHGTPLFGDIRELLDHQFGRLSALEQVIMFWLAIERSAIALDQLHAQRLPAIPMRTLLEALESLHRRSLLFQHEGRFTLQHAVMEYTTDRFVEQICQELTTGAIDRFMSHPLIIAEAADDIREAQIRLILAPIATRLRAAFSLDGLKAQLFRVLAPLRETQPHTAGYAAGNTLNLLLYLNYDLRGADFARLAVWQAYLRNACLQDVSFAHADLATSVFRDAFDAILTVAVSRDAQWIAAGTNNGDIRVWQAGDWTPLRTYVGHTDWVRSVAFSPDNRTLISGSDDQTLRLWDVASGRCRLTIPAHTGRVLAIALSPDGATLASGGEDRLIRLWDARDGRCMATLHGHTGWVCSLNFRADGMLLASASSDQTLRVWDAQSGRCQATMQGHTGWVWSAVFSPDGRTLASGGEDQTVRLWDVSTAHCHGILQGHTDGIWSVAFSASGTNLASASNDHTVRVWEVGTGQCRHTLYGHNGWVRSIAFTPDGSHVISGSSDQTLRVWDVGAGRCRYTLQGYTGWVCAVAFSPAGTYLASGSNQTVSLWEVATQHMQRTLPGHTGWVWSVAFSPDGTRLASVDHSGVKVWDTATWRELYTLQGHTGWVRSVAFSPRGEYLASASEDGTVRLWDAQTASCMHMLSGHEGWVWSVAFGPDSRIVASGSDDQTVRVWDVETGTCCRALHGHTNSIWSVAVSPDSLTLASGSDDHTIRLWDVQSGQCRQVLDEHTAQVRSVAFGHCPGLLASGSADQTVRIWDVQTGACCKVLRGHTSRVRSVAFSPDDRMVASCGDDETIRLWDVQTGVCITTMRSDRPYERMSITGASGLTEAQKNALKALGAIEIDAHR